MLGEKYLIVGYCAIPLSTVKRFNIYQKPAGDYVLQIHVGDEILEAEGIENAIINDDPESFLLAFCVLLSMPGVFQAIVLDSLISRTCERMKEIRKVE